MTGGRGGSRVRATKTQKAGEFRFMATEVKIRKGESVEKALRRLKKKLDREGVMKDIRAKRHFEKPCEKRRRKAARAKINARRATYAASL